MVNIKRLFYITFVVLALLSAFSVNVYAEDEFMNATASEFSVASCFGDNMVFQQNEPIKIWGTSPCEGEYVNAMFDGSFGYGKVIDGKWEIELAERTYNSEPKVLKIIGGPGSRYETFENIRIGDVWWVMGQSNAEYTCSADPNWASFEALLNGDDNVYLYSMKKNAMDVSSHTRWRRLNAHSAAGTSALACYTAHSIVRSTNNEVPIAMVVMAYSGHELAAFMPKELAKRYSSTGEKSFIYEDVVKHVMNMPIRGVIWYQGEADASIYSDYSEKLTAYIEWLRKEKAQHDKVFPIYSVELAPCFDDSDDPERQYINFGNVRSEAGGMTAKFENFNICVASDLWNDKDFSNNLHPYNKSLISSRLAGMIVSKEYAFGNEEYYFGPVLKNAELSSDGTEAILTFDYCGEGLSAQKFDGFSIIDNRWNIIKDTKYEIISHNQLKVNASDKISVIKYNSDTSNVFKENIFLANSNGVPAAAFTYYFSKPQQPLILIVLHYVNYIVPVIPFLLIVAVYIICRKKKKTKDSADTQ